MKGLRRTSLPPKRPQGCAAASFFIVAACLLTGVGSSGCAYQRDESAVSLVERGRFGEARERVAVHATAKPEDRNFILDQMKLVTMGLADGLPDVIEPTADILYDRLRTQGLNDENRFASIVLTEGSVRIYKGDPFEQALALAHIAILDGLKGDWGNMRAASQQSLFLLRDFSKAIQESGSSAGHASSSSRSRHASSLQPPPAPPDPSSQEQVALVRAAAEADRQGKSGEALGMDYTTVASDFELGYLLKAIAARKLGEREDMEEALKTLQQTAPRLNDVAGLVAGGKYNTVFVVDFGMAPEKHGTGPDNAIAARSAVTASDESPLHITVGSASSQWPVVTDMNRIASSTRWANLEDVRVAKSNIGSVLVAGGLIAATTADDDNQTQQLVGLIAAGVGALMKAGSSADTRHNELFPQRTYIALADLAQGLNRVELSIGQSRIVLPDVPGASVTGLELHYVRMPTNQEPWATCESVRYTNERSGAIGPDCFPYILGGRDVRPPTLQVLRDYQASGYLQGFSLDDLQQLYRDEEIGIAGVDGAMDRVGLHVLEGGAWLYTPVPASAGYKRLFYGDHPPYRPVSSRVKDLGREIVQQRARNSRGQEQTGSGSVQSQNILPGRDESRQSMDRGVVEDVFTKRGH